MHLQRHRGLSSGIKSGDLILQSQLEAVQPQISIDFGCINNLGDWIRQHELWQHNRLIRSVLQLIDEVVDRFHLQIGGGRLVWQRFTLPG